MKLTGSRRSFIVLGGRERMLGLKNNGLYNEIEAFKDYEHFVYFLKSFKIKGHSFPTPQ
jgi:hypothetical protein